MRLKHVSTILLCTVFTGAGVDRAHAQNKLFVGGLSWNPEDALLEIELSVHRRFVQRDDFIVELYVVVFDLANPDGDPVAEFIEWEPIVLTGPITRDRNGLVEIAPTSVPWDRKRGTFSGPATMCVMAQVVDRRGRPVRNADAEACVVVEIR